MGKFTDLIKDEARILLHNKKTLINILILGILILGLYLVITYRQQQIIKSQAANPAIVFTDLQGKALPEKAGIPYTSSTKVKVELTSPLGPATDATQSAIKTVKSKESSSWFLSNILVENVDAADDSWCTDGRHVCGNIGSVLDNCPKNGQTCTKYETYQCTTASGVNYCGDKGSNGAGDSECREPCSPISCPAGTFQQPASQDGQIVSNTIVGSDMQPYKGTGQCGYVYYHWDPNKSVKLANGDGCFVKVFTPWADQNACPKETTKYKCSGSACIQDPSGTYATKTACESACKTTSTKYKCSNNSCILDTSGTFTTKADCDKSCTASNDCSPDNKLTISPNPAKVGDTITFQYQAGEDAYLGDDTWSDGVNPNPCPRDGTLSDRRYKCTAQSTIANATWKHYWNTNSNTPSCGSKTYTIETATVATVTTRYRIAESKADLKDATWENYTADVMIFDYDFKTSGQKFIFVEFEDSTGKTGGCGEKKNQPCQAEIKILGPAPSITGCSLGFESGGNTTILNLTGTNFGSAKGVVKSGDKTLDTRQWKDQSIKAVYPGAPEGESLPVALTNSDGQVSPDAQCSATIQLSLGAKVFCRTSSAQDTANVDLVLAGDFAGGTKTKQKVTIDREGNVQGLSQKLEDGKKYKLSLKAPKSVRKTVPFTAGSGTINIPNFVLPVGDIFPAPGGDGAINALDKSELNRQWIVAGSGTGRTGDFNGDGRVNSIDWACMRYDFGSSDDTEPYAPAAAASIGVGTTAAQ